MRPPATNSSAGLVFVDTNVLIYARDVRTNERTERARAWMEALVKRGCVRINLQVLNELTRWIFRRETQRPTSDVRREVDALRVWGETPLDAADVATAWIVRERFGYQWFDCLLVAAAVRLGCRTFLTEDMTHGATFEGLTLVDPFRVGPDAFFHPL